MPLSVWDVFRFVTVKVRVVVAPSATEGAPNALEIFGGPATSSVAEVVPPVPPLAEVMAEVVTCWAPAAPACRRMVNVQDPAAGTLAFSSERSPASKSKLLPGQVLKNAVGLRLPGTAAWKATPVSAFVAFGLESVNVRSLVVLSPADVGEKAASMVGGLNATRSSEFDLATSTAPKVAWAVTVWSPGAPGVHVWASSSQYWSGWISSCV